MLVTGRDIFSLGEGSQLFPDTSIWRSRSTLCISERTNNSQLSLQHLNRDSNSNAKRITMNISGRKYETWEETLAIFPNTLLGCPDKRKKYFSFACHEYIFENDKDSFDAILFYYQSGGILSKPYNVDRHVFEKELQFFEIEDTFDRRNKFEKDLQQELEEQDPLPNGAFRRQIWMLFEYPHSSRFAKYLGYWSFLVILVSIIGLCAETVPELKTSTDIIAKNITVNNSIKLDKLTVNKPDYWFFIEWAAVSWFSIEYILRLYAAPKLLNFLLSALGAVDFFTIVPFYIGVIFKLSKVNGIGTTFGVIRILRLMRLARIFKLTRYNEGLKVILMALYRSGPHLRSIILIVILMSVLFAALIFYTENFCNPATGFFVSIPDSIWYALITQTSVGYGDIYPESSVGKLVGCVTAVFGVLLFCLPAPVLVNKFVECYYLRRSVSEEEDPQRKAFMESMKEIYFQ